MTIEEKFEIAKVLVSDITVHNLCSKTNKLRLTGLYDDYATITIAPIGTDRRKVVKFYFEDLLGQESIIKHILTALLK